MDKIFRFILKLAGPEYLAELDAFWDSVYQWERDQSNDWELYSADSETVQEACEQACKLRESDPLASLMMFRELADRGSVWPMSVVGWHFECGVAVHEDYYSAAQWYHRAVCNGSWSATLAYARVLAKLGSHADAEKVLQDGVDCGFTPSLFRLAELRYQRNPNRRTAREIRPLLEEAMEAGHPAAERTLARMMISGKLGLVEIPEGWGRVWRHVRDD